MKIYVTARFKGEENKSEIETLCRAVREAGMEDFCFVRDIENYQKTFSDVRELWVRAKKEIAACDALLIDISDYPSGGRVIEAGIAYGLGLPIYTVVKNGSEYKELYDGIGKVIRCERIEDITAQLVRYLKNASL